MKIDSSFASASSGLQNIINNVKSAGDSVSESITSDKFEKIDIPALPDSNDSDGIDVSV